MSGLPIRLIRYSVQFSTSLTNIRQVPDFACASVALLNIVMNIPDAHLGPQLEQFKLSTQSLHPVSRGDAIASCEFVRSAHNSFARDNDMLHIDNLLKTKYANLIKRQKLDAVNAARVAKTAEKRSQRPFAPKRNDGRASRSNPARKARASNLSENDDLFDSEAFHFVAYMPVDGQVWKLDGMDYSPQLVENVSEGQQWLKIAQSELLTQMMQYLEGQIEFSLMAVIDDPNTVGTKSLAENVKAMQELDGKLDTLSSNWRENFVPILPDDNEDTVHDLSGKYCVTEDDVKRAVLPASFMEELEEKSLEELVQLRRELFMTQGSLTVGIRSQDRQDQGDAAKTLHRRYDYGSFVDGWFSALAEEDALRPLLEKDE